MTYDLGELGSLKNGANFNKNDAGDGCPVMSVKQLFRGRYVDTEGLSSIRIGTLKKLDDYLVRKNDLLFARSSLKAEGSGQVAIVNDYPENCIFSGFTIRFRLFDESKVNPLYLYYLLRSAKYREIFVRITTGSVISNLTQATLSKIPVELPNKETQDYVAKILDELDRKNELATATNQTLEQMAQAIFKSWFVDFDPVKAKMNGEQPEGMDAATASLFPEKLVESELGLIPEGWPVDQVGNHIELTKGKSYKSSELQESTTALVTLKSFKRGGGYRMDGLKEYTGTYKPQQVIEAGDLVMSLTDVTQAAEIVGKPALVIEAPQYDTLVASLDVAILRPKETDAKQYFYGLMSTYRFHRYAESFATGTTVLHLSPKGITTFEFACPSTELVKKYHEFAAPIFAKIEANILESQELVKLRDTLLPKLLSGEIELETSKPLIEAIQWLPDLETSKQEAEAV